MVVDLKINGWFEAMALADWREVIQSSIYQPYQSIAIIVRLTKMSQDSRKESKIQLKLKKKKKKI